MLKIRWALVAVGGHPRCHLGMSLRLPSALRLPLGRPKGCAFITLLGGTSNPLPPWPVFLLGSTSVIKAAEDGCIEVAVTSLVILLLGRPKGCAFMIKAVDLSGL